MNNARPLAAALAFVSAVSCATDKEITASGTTVAISELRQSPESYYGQKVTVAGYATLEFENYNLWATSKDARKHNCKNAIGIDSSNTEIPNEFNRSHVVISGIFDTWCKRDNLVEGEDVICISTGSCGEDEIFPDTIYKLK